MDLFYPVGYIKQVNKAGFS